MYRGARHVLGVSGPACRLGPGPAGPVAKREAIGCRGVSIGSHFLHDALAMSADLVIAIVILWSSCRGSCGPVATAGER